MSRNITLGEAETIIAACKTEAGTVGQPMNIAVVDDGANLVAASCYIRTAHDRADVHGIGNRQRWFQRVRIGAEQRLEFGHRPRPR